MCVSLLHFASIVSACLKSATHYALRHYKTVMLKSKNIKKAEAAYTVSYYFN